MDKIDKMSTEIIYTNQPYPLLYYNNNLNKCSPEKKCPCPTWLNCPYYIDIIQQEIRLKLKSPERKSKINEWYETYFKADYEFHNLYSSG